MARAPRNVPFLSMPSSGQTPIQERRAHEPDRTTSTLRRCQPPAWTHRIIPPRALDTIERAISIEHVHCPVRLWRGQISPPPRWRPRGGARPSRWHPTSADVDTADAEGRAEHPLGGAEGPPSRNGGHHAKPLDDGCRVLPGGSAGPARVEGCGGDDAQADNAGAHPTVRASLQSEPSHCGWFFTASLLRPPILGRQKEFVVSSVNVAYCPQRLDVETLSRQASGLHSATAPRAARISHLVYAVCVSATLCHRVAGPSYVSPINVQGLPSHIACGI